MPAQATLTISRGSVGSQKTHQRAVQARVVYTGGDTDERTFQCVMVGKTACIWILGTVRAEKIRKGKVMRVIHDDERGAA